MRLATTALILAVALSHAVMSGERLVGAASVIDGDTIEIHGQRIRLFGIDAQESSQTCTQSGVTYRCGQTAAFALADRIGHRVVSCEQRDTDRYRRVVAVCSEGGVDLNEWMVSQGQAIAYRQYSLTYVPAEEKAKAARLGIWAGEFQNPAEFRHAGHPGFSARKSPSIARRTARHIRPHIVSRHTGRCLRLNDLDAVGHRCGARSAASKAGRT